MDAPARSRPPLALVLALVLGLVVLGAVLVVWQLGRSATRAVSDVGEVLERFRTGRVTERFIASLPVAADAGRGRLEVATLEATEVFRREDERRIAWDLVPLGTTVAEIRVPVVYRYHVDLADPWEVEVDGSVCRILAPTLRATVPVAVRTDQMEKRLDTGWAHLDASAQMAELERSLTAQLTASARHPSRVDLAREPARRTIAAFVRDWLLTEQVWGEGGIEAVVVRFAGEEGDSADPTLAFGETE